MNIEEYQQQFLGLLRTSVVTFHYRKKDRSLRKAIGTTCLDLIPTDSLPKGIGAPAPKGQVRYYDFTVGGWRTLRLAHVTSYSLPEAKLPQLRTIRRLEFRVSHPIVVTPNGGQTPVSARYIWGFVLVVGQTRGSAPTARSDLTGKGNHNYQLLTVNYPL